MNARRNALLLIALGALMAFSAILVSCAPDTEAPALNEEARAIVAQEDETADPQATEEVSDITQVAFTDQECLDCHTDEALLQELAVEEENAAEELSSGPG